jgi:hypothetical protein
MKNQLNGCHLKDIAQEQMVQRLHCRSTYSDFHNCFQLYWCWQKCVAGEEYAWKATVSKGVLQPPDLRYGSCAGLAEATT